MSKLFYLLTIFLLTCGNLSADDLRVFSVTEDAAGNVAVTAGIDDAYATPDATAFRLRFAGGAEIPANEIRHAPSFPLATSMVLSVDQSGSMGRARTKQIQDALATTLREASANSKQELKFKLALFAFDTEVRRLQDFTTNTSLLAKGVAEIASRSGTDGRTKLYEAIELGLAELRSRDDKDQKRLVLITDGNDDGSSITDKVVASKASARNIAIDAIGFGKVAESDSEVLERLANNTGGHFVLATDEKELAREIDEVFNTASPRMLEISFKYDVPKEAPEKRTAQLEFRSEGMGVVSQAIAQELSAPRTEASPEAAPAPAPASAPTPADDDEWTIEINSTKVDVRVLIAAVAGMLGIGGAAYKWRKKPSEASPAISSSSSQPVSPAPPKAGQPAPRRATVVGYSFPEPARGHPTAFLLLLSGAGRGRRHAIEKTTYRIGADDSSELQLSDERISRTHARIEYESGTLYLRDSGSSNGTFLNDSRLHGSAAVLSPGDKIRVGNTTLELTVSDGSAEDKA